MPTHITHDAPSITTVSGQVGHRGSTTRPVVTCDHVEALSTGTTVRLVLDGHQFFTVPRPSSRDAVQFTGAYDTTGGVRDADAENRLIEWVDDRDLAVGRTVHVDVIDEGFRYGFRAPGESATYAASEPVTDLTDIARDL